MTVRLNPRPFKPGRLRLVCERHGG